MLLLCITESRLHACISCASPCLAFSFWYIAAVVEALCVITSLMCSCLTLVLTNGWCVYCTYKCRRIYFPAGWGQCCYCLDDIFSEHSEQFGIISDPFSPTRRASCNANCSNFKEHQVSFCGSCTQVLAPGQLLWACIRVLAPGQLLWVGYWSLGNHCAKLWTLWY